MSENRVPDYLSHIQQAATDACSFVEGLGRDEFLADKRTRQDVIKIQPVPEMSVTALVNWNQTPTVSRADLEACSLTQK